MNLIEYKETQGYRNHLARSLEIAKLQLNAKNFQALSIGINQEIDRLDAELSTAPVHILLFGAQKEWGNWASVAFASRTPMIFSVACSVAYNSPSNTNPWTNQISYDSSQRIQVGTVVAGTSA